MNAIQEVIKSKKSEKQKQTDLNFRQSFSKLET
jgi:hypothetical protein